MADYERSTSVSVAPEAAFEWLSDPANMPRYVATLTGARPAGAGLHVTAVVDGRGHEEGDATFSADQSSRRVKWGRLGHDYHGEIAVAADGAGSQVTLRLHTRSGADAAQIERALDETIANIRSALAG